MYAGGVSSSVKSVDRTEAHPHSSKAALRNSKPRAARARVVAVNLGKSRAGEPERVRQRRDGGARNGETPRGTRRRETRVVADGCQVGDLLVIPDVRRARGPAAAHGMERRRDDP